MGIRSVPEAIAYKTGNLLLQIEQSSNGVKYCISRGLTESIRPQPPKPLWINFVTMLLKDKQTGTLLKILDTDALIDPMKPTVTGRDQAGQEEQDPEEYAKDALVFPSDENLPKCWLDADYQMKK